jgi:hypothetical protein
MADPLENAALDAAVARALGLVLREAGTAWAHLAGARSLPGSQGDPEPWRPSTDFRVGGPLLEEHDIATAKLDGAWYAMLPTNPGRGVGYIDAYAEEWDASGPTMLIAGMRALLLITKASA